MKNFSKFLEEITIKGNVGMPGEEKGDEPKYLRDIERKGSEKIRDVRDPRPLFGEIMNLMQRGKGMVRGKENELEQFAEEMIRSVYSGILDNVDLDIKLVRDGNEVAQFMEDEECEECEEKSLETLEGKWIEHHKSWHRDNGYNLVRFIDGRIQKYDHVIEEKVLHLFKEGLGKNTIAKQLGVTRNTVYSHLERNNIHQNTGRGSEIKLTDEVKQHITELRQQNKTLTEISEMIGVGMTQLRRTETIGDGLYCTNKVKRESYRTVTPEVIEQVKTLREQGLKWEDIEKEVGVSRFALHQNGITEKFKNPSAHKVKKNKVSQEVKDKIDAMLNEVMSIKHISEVTGVAQSTIRWRRDKNVIGGNPVNFHASSPRLLEGKE